MAKKWVKKAKPKMEKAAAERVGEAAAGGDKAKDRRAMVYDHARSVKARGER